MEAVVKRKAVDSPFAYSLFFAAGALAREVEKLAIECWKPTGLSPSLGQLLYFMLHYEQVTGPMVIAQNLYLSPSTVTRLLEKLEKKGFVHRFIYDKTRMVKLTDKTWKAEPLISDCDFLFRKKCDSLLGEEIGQLCPLLTTTADKIRSGEDVRKPTEKSPKNTDLYREN